MKPGYQGKDSMREKAEKMTRGGFKKGGHVVIHKKHKHKNGCYDEGGEVEALGRNPATYSPVAAKKEGGSLKMAMGGVGKIRHKQSTKSGKQIKPRASTRKG